MTWELFKRNVREISKRFALDVVHKETCLPGHGDKSADGLERTTQERQRDQMFSDQLPLGIGLSLPERLLNCGPHMPGSQAVQLGEFMLGTLRRMVSNLAQLLLGSKAYLTPIEDRWKDGRANHVNFVFELKLGPTAISEGVDPPQAFGLR